MGELFVRRRRRGNKRPSPLIQVFARVSLILTIFVNYFLIRLAGIEADVDKMFVEICQLNSSSSKAKDTFLQTYVSGKDAFVSISGFVTFVFWIKFNVVCFMCQGVAHIFVPPILFLQTQLNTELARHTQNPNTEFSTNNVMKALELFLNSGYQYLLK